MDVRELIKALLDVPPDSEVYIGKGMGPLAKVAPVVKDKVYVILSPEPPR